MRQITLSIASLVFLPLATFAADPKPKDVILGKWESLDGISKGVIVEFKKDGTTEASYNGKVMTTGKYKFIDDDTMEFEQTFLNTKQPLIMKFRMQIKGDELTQTDLKTNIQKKMKKVK